MIILGKTITKLTEDTKEPKTKKTIKLTKHLDYPDVVEGRFYSLTKSGYNTTTVVPDFKEKYVNNLPYPFHTRKLATNSFDSLFFLKKEDAESFDPNYPIVHGNISRKIVRIDVDGDIPCYCNLSRVIAIYKETPDAIHPVIAARLNKQPVQNPFLSADEIAKNNARLKKLNKETEALKQIDEWFKTNLGIETNISEQFTSGGKYGSIDIPVNKILSEPYEYHQLFMSNPNHEVEKVEMSKIYNSNVEISWSVSKKSIEFDFGRVIPSVYYPINNCLDKMKDIYKQAGIDGVLAVFINLNIPNAYIHNDDLLISHNSSLISLISYDIDSRHTDYPLVIHKNVDWNIINRRLDLSSPTLAADIAKVFGDIDETVKNHSAVCEKITNAIIKEADKFIDDYKTGSIKIYDKIKVSELESD